MTVEIEKLEELFHRAGQPPFFNPFQYLPSLKKLRTKIWTELKGAGQMGVDQGVVHPMTNIL